MWRSRPPSLFVNLGMVSLGIAVVILLVGHHATLYRAGRTTFTQQQQLPPECTGIINSSRMAEVQECLATGACPWQPVLGGLDTIRVLSAHLDNRFDQPFVRVIAMAGWRQALQEDIWCLYPAFESQHPLSTHTCWHAVKANVTLMKDDRTQPYSGAFLDCPLQPEVSKPPFMSVSIGPRQSMRSTSGLDLMCETGNMVPVNHGQFPGPQVEFGACIKVMHGNIPPAKEFVEFVEFSRLLGVEHFTFYNDTTNERSRTPSHINASCALRCYEEQGLVKVMDFGLDVDEIEVKGSVISTNDCVYQRRHQYKHHVQVDTDEFIVPSASQPSQYHDFLQALRAAHNISEEAANDVQEYGFQMSYFPEACRSADSKYRYENMLRKDAVFGYGHRSKYISVTKNVIEAGPHIITRGLGEKVVASSDMALVHHHRGLGEQACTEVIEDRTADRYRRELNKNIDSFLDSCESRCGRLF